MESFSLRQDDQAFDPQEFQSKDEKASNKLLSGRTTTCFVTDTFHYTVL